MELSDSCLIALTQSDAPGKTREQSHRPTPEQASLSRDLAESTFPSAVPKSRKTRPRCSCGQCSMCLEEARWERIFRAKFADPHYYTRRIPVGGSSLGWLARRKDITPRGALRNKPRGLGADCR
jgi:hypothetical protein